MAESENKTAEINEVTELGQTRQGSIHCLSIIGQIEGHQILPEDVKTTKYEHVLPMLAAIEESPEITGLLILLNTVGGDVEAGLAIAELIAGMSTPTVSLVLGGGHSIGVPLAVAAKRSFIAPTASMTAARMPPFSSAYMPSMVVPPGEQTASLSAPGCSPVSCTILAAPMSVCAASS